MSFLRQINVKNQANIDLFIKDNLIKISQSQKSTTLIDVGAGTSPYKNLIQSFGFEYFSHDFNGYIPSEDEYGLQNSTWDYAKHDFVCDILEIPEDKKFDVAICTEVLEHVPDPVASLRKITSIVKPGGTFLITVPFMSLMHQAPHWHSAGLSPFWFEKWSNELGIKIETLLVSGDYVDLIKQEFGRITYCWWVTKPIGYLVLNTPIFNFLRKMMPKSLLDCGGFTTMFVGKKL